MSSITHDIAALKVRLEDSVKTVTTLSQAIDGHILGEINQHGSQMFETFEQHWLEPILRDLGHDPKEFSVDVGETEFETVRHEGKMLCDAVRASVVAAEQPTDQEMVLRAAAPVLCVPKFSAFLPLERVGHRFLMARDGPWLEVRRPWLHLIYPLAKVKGVAMPFGELAITVDLAFDRQDQIEFIRDMAKAGRAQLPNEIGNWVAWQSTVGVQGRLVWANSEHAVGEVASLEYERPAHSARSSPCIDIHTHGVLPAGFSGTDNLDDAGEVKIAIVIGNLDQKTPSIEARLCCLGLMIPVPVKAEEIFA